MKIIRKTSSPDYVFLILVVFLVIFGLVMLTSASSDIAQIRFGNSNYFLRHQIQNGLFFGIAGFLIGFFLFYRFWGKVSALLFLISIVFLLLILATPLGIEIKGAERWLSLGPVVFQPGEILKLTFLIYVAAWMSRKKERLKKWTEGFLPFLILIFIAMGLLFIQPAATTAIIIGFSALVVYFIAGARMNFIFTLTSLLIIGASVLVFVTPYRLIRVVTFLNPEADPLTSGYHISQTKLAIGAGGLTGVGFGKSTTKLNYLPEPIGDSIFAVIAEELGFIGSGLLVIVFLILIWRGLLIAQKAPDSFGKLVVVGFVTLFGIQAFVNIGSISGVVPLTGVPLPFISFGGTSLAVFLTMSGIILNISKYGR